MARPVKNRPRVAGGSRVSSKHQVTIPAAAFAAAGLREGDAVRFEVDGPGRLIVTREADVLDEFSGALSGGADLRAEIERLRDEWD